MIPRIKRVHDIDDTELKQLQTRIWLLEELYRAVRENKETDSIVMRLEAYGVPHVFKKLKLS